MNKINRAEWVNCENVKNHSKAIYAFAIVLICMLILLAITICYKARKVNLTMIYVFYVFMYRAHRPRDFYNLTWTGMI